ncbi:hypothetical protein GYMLUDRAFT_42328 [Collybiopsis luxurians FD-317 M1]|uniref:DUF6533 domain-containing protein n=1 Tax=Collybiopsis luxurians FD-317 M1 TaxID=944289 RepID=A0A0D0CRN7_9AGAR|nr:hypothetical protein GYMLUDRAFT_42328 [Collybiopsis luxurians FD-317 M1]
MTFMFWDHLLTFPDELQFLWKLPVRPSTVLFFLSRYLAVLGNIVVTVSLFSTSLSESSCQPLHSFHQFLLVVLQIIVGLLLTIRIYVLYHCSKRVLTVLLTIACILVGLSIFATFFGHSNHSGETSGTGCRAELSFISSVQIAAAWEALFLYDSILFGMMLYRAYRTRHELRILRQLRVSLFVIVVRDGSLYFGIMALANALNISTFYYPLPYVRASLSTFASGISITMMSRLFFNLHQIAESGLYTSHIMTVQLGTHETFIAAPPDRAME